jgi:hypothetical protein
MKTSKEMSQCRDNNTCFEGGRLCSIKWAFCGQKSPLKLRLPITGNEFATKYLRVLELLAIAAVDAVVALLVAFISLSVAPAIKVSKAAASNGTSLVSMPMPVQQD